MKDSETRLMASAFAFAAAIIVAASGCDGSYAAAITGLGAGLAFPTSAIFTEAMKYTRR